MKKLSSALLSSLLYAIGCAGADGATTHEGVDESAEQLTSGLHGDSTRASTNAAKPTTYGGGAVLSNVQIVSVFWGSKVDSTVTRGIGGFYKAVADSPHLDWLREYDTPKQSIGRGTFSGNTTITPASTSTSVREATIGDELAAQINAKKLPVPTANTVYMVHFPKGTTITEGDGSVSCTDFCGFHNVATRTVNKKSTKIVFGVLPYFGKGGCACGDRGVFDNFTKTAAHELLEAITDPQPFSGWSPEIGDACNYATIGDAAYATLVASNGTNYAVQLEWSQSATQCVSGLEVAQVVEGTNQDGRLESFYIRTNGAIYHKWQTTPNGAWSYEEALGGLAKRIAVGQNSNGSLELFYIGTDDALYHNYQTAPNGAWSGEFGLGGSAKQIAVGQNENGSLELFYVGTDDALYHNYQTSGGWSGEYAFGGSAKQLSVARNSDGTQEVVYVGTNTSLYHNRQTGPNGDWGGEAALGGAAKQVTLGSNADGHLELVYIGTDDALYHNWETSPSGTWNGEASLGGYAKQIVLGQNADGHLELVYIGTDDALYHNWQYAPNSGWNGEAPFGGYAKQLTIGQNADGHLEVVYVGTNDALYHNWQLSPNGDWNGEAVF